METTQHLKRLFAWQDPKSLDSNNSWDAVGASSPVNVPVPESEANLVVSSTGVEDLHLPALDLDRMNVRLVESSTPGNYHLYIDKPVPWARYLDLLGALADAGIIERGFLLAAMARGFTALRHNCKKPMGDVVETAPF